MILVDSSVWIAHFRNEPHPEVARLRALDPVQDILVGDLILLELLQGARDEPHAARIERTLRAFAIVPLLDERLAVEAASRYRALRATGVTVRKSADLVIASYCLEHGCRLLQRDRDFAPFVSAFGLRLA